MLKITDSVPSEDRNKTNYLKSNIFQPNLVKSREKWDCSYAANKSTATDKVGCERLNHKKLDNTEPLTFPAPNPSKDFNHLPLICSSFAPWSLLHRVKQQGNRPFGPSCQ